jgi:hypothetical protein
MRIGFMRRFVRFAAVYPKRMKRGLKETIVNARGRPERGREAEKEVEREGETSNARTKRYPPIPHHQGCHQRDVAPATDFAGRVPSSSYEG